MLPSAVPVCLELLTTAQTHEIIVGFSFNHIRIFIPPVIATGITAEKFPFTLWNLLDPRAAVFTWNGAAVFSLRLEIRDGGRMISRFHGFQIHPHLLSHLAVAHSFSPQFPCHLFLIVCHHLSLLSYDCILASSTMTPCH